MRAICVCEKQNDEKESLRTVALLFSSQRKKSVTDADYATESVLLANEYQGHLNRRLKSAACSSALSRSCPDPKYESQVRGKSPLSAARHA